MLSGKLYNFPLHLRVCMVKSMHMQHNIALLKCCSLISTKKKHWTLPGIYQSKTNISLCMVIALQA